MLAVTMLTLIRIMNSSHQVKVREYCPKQMMIRRISTAITY